MTEVTDRDVKLYDEAYAEGYRQWYNQPPGPCQPQSWFLRETMMNAIARAREEGVVTGWSSYAATLTAAFDKGVPSCAPEHADGDKG